ncbi:hypothetical protein [Spiroplasma sp. Moj]|uniref:hypothetical protein n=1 Tax=Spiroplasma sp. Moj TaxID=1922342 RepID=UPI0039F05370
MMKGFKKYLVSKKMQGVLTWFVYPVLGSLISICLILFVIGQPIALLINVIFSGLTTLQTSNLAAILGIIIGMMCVFDLGVLLIKWHELSHLHHFHKLLQVYNWLIQPC